MRIGVMLRDINNQVDAPGILMLNLMDKIIEIDRENEYVLFFKDIHFINRYDVYPNVKSILIRSANKLIWDQVMIPLFAMKEKIDILFHPKHSIPFFTSCKTIMHLRGAGYWVNPHFSKKLDLIYQRTISPLYVKKATHVIVESDTVKELFKKFLKVDEKKMTRIYLAPSERFKVISDKQQLDRVRKRYRLPSEFILTVTRVVENKTMYYPGKNLIKALAAFQQFKLKYNSKLNFVIVGRNTKSFIENLENISDQIKESIFALDFVPQKDLPEIYNLAKFFLFPSINESFGIPLTEAMACGCPVITSTITSCPEIVGESAIKIDPFKVEEITEAIAFLDADKNKREELKKNGKEEMKRFCWKRSAEEHIKIFNSIMV